MPGNGTGAVRGEMAVGADQEGLVRRPELFFDKFAVTVRADDADFQVKTPEEKADPAPPVVKVTTRARRVVKLTD